jgi:hypothetical protein
MLIAVTLAVAVWVEGKSGSLSWFCSLPGAGKSLRPSLPREVKTLDIVGVLKQDGRQVRASRFVVKSHGHQGHGLNYS